MGKLAWLSLLSTVWLAACATEPAAPPAAEPEAAKPISSVEPALPAEVSAPKAAKPVRPKARRKDKAAEKAAAEKAQAEKAAAEAKPASETPATPEPTRTEPVAKAQVIKGPAWLARCAAKRIEGGVILCDADSLLVQPSATVKVYTREPALAGKVASGVIAFRANLPRRYRLFIVP